MIEIKRILLLCIFIILAAGLATASGGSGGASGPLNTAESSVSSDSCEKFYTCPDGTTVQYCFLQKIANEAGEVTGAACGCKDPEEMCLQKTKLQATAARPISSECSMSAELMEKYNSLISELKEAEQEGDEDRAETITSEIIELKKEINEQREQCTESYPAYSGKAVAVSAKMPTAVSSGGEIKDYYKKKIEGITSSDDVEGQIRNLKELRNEIDGLIEKLIESREEIQTEEVRGLVSEIRFKAGEIRADEVEIRTTEKRILTKLNERQISIEPKEADVVITDESVEVKADEVSLEGGVLRVGSSEVKISPTEVVNKLQISPKKVELKEENSKAVYKVQGNEQRKLLGVIPVDVEKEVTVDANDNNIVSEQSSWYAFLTTK